MQYGLLKLCYCILKVRSGERKEADNFGREPYLLTMPAFHLKWSLHTRYRIQLVLYREMQFYSNRLMLGALVIMAA